MSIRARVSAKRSMGISDHTRGAVAAADRIPYAAMIEIDLQGKRGLVMGVANSRSLGWAIAERLHEAGAELAFSYQGERLREDLEKLTRDWPGTRLSQCDVTNDDGAQGHLRRPPGRLGEPRLRRPFHRLRPAGGDGRALHRDHPRRLADGARHLRLLAGRRRPRGRAAAQRRGLDHHPHLLRRREGGAQVQRHGHRQERPRGQRPLPGLRAGEERGAGQRRVGRPGAHRGGALASPAS